MSDREVFTRITLETRYDERETITVSITSDRSDLTTDELVEHMRGILLASGYSPDSVDAEFPPK